MNKAFHAVPRRSAGNSLVVVAIAVAARAGLQSAAGWAQSRLEPQVDRVVELRLLDLTSQVELARAVADHGQAHRRAGRPGGARAVLLRPQPRGRPQRAAATTS